MKSIFLTVFFATFCLIQAHQLDLSLHLYYNGQSATNGTLSCILHGESTEKEITFDKKEFFEYEDITLTTDFPEEVLSVSFSWKSEPEDKPLMLGYFMIYVDNNKSNSVNFVLVKNIKSGTTEKFDKLD